MHFAARDQEIDALEDLATIGEARVKVFDFKHERPFFCENPQTALTWALNQIDEFLEQTKAEIAATLNVPAERLTLEFRLTDH